MQLDRTLTAITVQTITINTFITDNVIFHTILTVNMNYDII